MESGKLDIDSEAKSPKEPVATYKPIPEDDSVLPVKESAKEEVKMAKHDGDTDTDDGAQELMLKNTGKINSNKDASEVKFISENGDAKIDIETAKQTLTGMTKEELMKFANDPFWIRLRWFMFLTFWILWAAMLAGAIAIIIMAPKCAAPEPKKVWQQSAIVRLNPLALGNNLTGLEATLDHLKKNHIKVISIQSLFNTSAAGHTTDFRDIHPSLGSINDFNKLVQAARERDQEIILEVDPNHTSEEHSWFNKSIHRIDPYTNFYVWENPKTAGGKDGKGTPPTNWLSVYNGSAWEWNDVRKQYYLHQFSKAQPDLNYRNPAVVEEFSSIWKHWMKLGVAGFRLANTQYLLEDLAAGDEAENHVPAEPESYHSLVHVHTHDLNNNTNILQEWRKVVSNQTENKGLFSLLDVIKNGTLESLMEISVVDLPLASNSLYAAKADITATAIQTAVNNTLPSLTKPKKADTEEKIKEVWPAWDLNGQEKTLDERMNSSIAESLTLMTLLLPGTPIISLNQTKYPGEAFETLAKAREEPAFLHGETATKVDNGTIFVYTRLKSGNPGYLVAYQSGDVEGTLDLSKYDKVPEEVTIIALSSNYAVAGNAVKSRIASNSVRLSPKSTLVVQFAPKSD